MSEWVVPGYTELKELGSGGFGSVALARHDATGTPVAIKYLRADLTGDPYVAELFRAELGGAPLTARIAGWQPFRTVVNRR